MPLRMAVNAVRQDEMLRKKYHVVRKKNHVVRKIFYVASIFDGAAGRENGARADKKMSYTDIGRHI